MQHQSTTGPARVILFGTALATGLMLAYLAITADMFVQTASDVRAATYIQPLSPTKLLADPLPGTIDAVNAYRASKHLSPVKLNAELNRSAQAKADDLVAHQYFSHFRDGVVPWDFFKAAGYQYVTAGEVLAKCYADGPAVVEAWIKSSTHEAVLSGDYLEAGFGVTWNEENHCTYVAGHFGSRM